MAPARHGAARTRPRAESPRPRQQPRVLSGGARGIRWDRVGRVALLLVLVGVVALYVGPSIRWVQTYREAQARQGEIRQLKSANRRLQARRRALGDPRTMEREARRLGLVKPGERPFIVKGLSHTGR